MQERQVTVDGVTHALESPFMVIATQNPIEYEGTYPLPEAQLDRFMMLLHLGYPELADEARDDRRAVDRRTRCRRSSPSPPSTSCAARSRGRQALYVEESVCAATPSRCCATRAPTRG